MATKAKDKSEESEGTTSDAKNTHVEYVGVGREVKVRRLTAADFAKMGVEDQGVVEFRRENGWKQVVGEGGLSADAANALLERDSKNFKPSGA